MKYFYFIWLAVLASIICSGCAQLSSLQTARVLKQGEVSIGLAGFGYGANDDGSVGGGLGDIILPNMEFFGRYGLGAGVDIGLKLSTGGNALLDGKYQFLGRNDGRFAMAVGGGLEYQAAPEVLAWRAHLPVYASYHFNEKGAVYATPRYVFQYVEDNDNSHFGGGSLGYSHWFNNRWRGLLEASYYSVGNEQLELTGDKVFLFGVGVGYHFNK